MRFQELEKYRHQNSRFDVLIPQLDDYFGFYLKGMHSDSWQDELAEISIVPSNIANKLKISEALALALLAFADDEKLVKPAYEVYCKRTDDWMAEYPSISLIPDCVYCARHDEEHSKENFYVKLVFHFTSEAWEHFSSFSHKM